MCNPPERLVLEGSFFALVLDFIALVMLDELYAWWLQSAFQRKATVKS